MTRMLLAACMLLYHTSWRPVCYHTIISTELRLAFVGGTWMTTFRRCPLFRSVWSIVYLMLYYYFYYEACYCSEGHTLIWDWCTTVVLVQSAKSALPHIYIWMLCLMNVGVIAVMEEQGEGRASHWRGSSVVGDGQNPGDVNYWSISYRCLRWTVWATAQGRPCAGMMLWVCGAAAVYHLEVHYGEHKCGPCTEYWRC